MEFNTLLHWLKKGQMFLWRAVTVVQDQSAPFILQHHISSLSGSSDKLFFFHMRIRFEKAATNKTFLDQRQLLYRKLIWRDRGVLVFVQMYTQCYVTTLPITESLHKLVKESDVRFINNLSGPSVWSPFLLVWKSPWLHVLDTELLYLKVLSLSFRLSLWLPHLFSGVVE